MKLQEWRQMIFRRDHASSQYDFTAILGDDLVTVLASVGKVTQAKASHALRKWVWWDKYGGELTAFLVGLEIPFIPLEKKTLAATSTPATTVASTPMPATSKHAADVALNSLDARSSKRVRISGPSAERQNECSGITQHHWGTPSATPAPFYSPLHETHLHPAPLAWYSQPQGAVNEPRAQPFRHEYVAPMSPYVSPTMPTPTFQARRGVANSFESATIPWHFSNPGLPSHTYGVPSMQAPQQSPLTPSGSAPWMAPHFLNANEYLPPVVGPSSALSRSPSASSSSSAAALQVPLQLQFSSAGPPLNSYNIPSTHSAGHTPGAGIQFQHYSHPPATPTPSRKRASKTTRKPD